MMGSVLGGTANCWSGIGLGLVFMACSAAAPLMEVVFFTLVGVGEVVSLEEEEEEEARRTRGGVEGAELDIECRRPERERKQGED